MKILWVEDGGASLQPSKVAKAMFSGLLSKGAFDQYDTEEEFQTELPRLFAASGRGGSQHEIVVCRSFDDWLDVSEAEALDFDAALLDINLEGQKVAKPPIQVSDFERRAGLYIYHQLREQHGMAPEHIAFFSGEGATMSVFQTACSEAMLKPPANLFEKKQGDFKKVDAWLRSIAECPYQQLRRAVLDGCSELTSRLRGFEEVDLAAQFALFRPANPAFSEHWEAYRDGMERYFQRLRQALPMQRPLDLGHYYLSLVQELTQPWQGDGDLPPVCVPEQVSTADHFFARNAPGVLRLWNDWVTRDLLSDALETEDVAYLALLTARSWGPWRTATPLPFESSLLDLLPAPVSSTKLRSRLTKEVEECLAESLEVLAQVLPHGEDVRGAGDFMSVCEAVTRALQQLEPSELADAYAQVRSNSLVFLHQAFWHALTPASQEPLLFFRVQDLTAGSLLEEVGRRIYAKSFPVDPETS